MQCCLPTKKVCMRSPTVHEYQIQWLVVLHFVPYIILKKKSLEKQMYR